MTKLQRCCVHTDIGNIWVQGKTIPDLCLDFHRKMTTYMQNDSSFEPPKPIPVEFEAYANEWWELYGSKRVQTGTATDYRMNLRKHVIPFFKGMVVSEITTRDIQRFYDAGSQYAASTCRHWKTLLFGIFNSAIEDGLIDKNPAASKRLTMSSRKKERLPISRICAAEIQEKLPMLDLPDRTLLSILLFTGVRRGEMLGLQWGDLDFDNRLIHINRQVSFVNNRPVIKVTKTQAGIRSVPMLPELESILCTAASPAYSDTDFVVSGKTPFSERSFRNTWARISKRIDLPSDITPHVLRHTFLTELEASGNVDLKTLQSIAGHSKISITMNTYVHCRTENVQKVSQTGAGLYQR